MVKRKDEAKAKRLADLAGVGQVFEGDQVKLTDIAGEEVEVLDFKFIPSQFREGENYVCIQIRRGGKLEVVNSQATVIMRALQSIDKAALPAPAVFRMAEPKKPGGKPYWMVE